MDSIQSIEVASIVTGLPILHFQGPLFQLVKMKRKILYNYSVFEVVDPQRSFRISSFYRCEKMELQVI